MIKKPFEKIVGKGENPGNQHFLLFPQCFLLYLRHTSVFQSHSFLSSAYGLNFDQYKNLSFGKGLNVFCTFCEVDKSNDMSSAEWLTLSQKSPVFFRVCSSSLLKTLWENGKLLIMSNFSFFPPCFLPVWKTFYHFYQIQNCRLQTLSVWKGLKFVVWERINSVQNDNISRSCPNSRQEIFCRRQNLM